MFNQSFSGAPPHNGTHGENGTTVYQSIWNLKRLLNRISSKPCSTDQLELARSLLEPLLACKELYPDEITSLECRVMNLLVEDDHSYESNSLGDQEDLLLDDDGLGPKSYSTKSVEETTQVAETSPQDMLEAEISEMAHQLKNSSLHMHSTLAQQNKTMDSIAETQQGNLDKVHAATDKVQDHLKRGWKRSFFTWTLFFIIMGCFAFLILLIRTVPKRKGACIWFLCSEEDAAYQYYYRQKQKIEKEQEQRYKREQSFYQQQKQQQQQQKKKPTEPKYSYCEIDEENDSNRCSSPQPKQVHDSIVTKKSESPLYAEEYVMETKMSRLQYNMKVAEESEPATFYNENEEDGYEKGRTESSLSEEEEEDYFVEEEDDYYVEEENEEVKEVEVEVEVEEEELVEEDEVEEETKDEPSEDNKEYERDPSTPVSDLQEGRDKDDETSKTCQSHPELNECTMQKVDAANISLENIRKLMHTPNGTPQLLEILEQHPEVLVEKDGNGWQLIHEAVYTGNADLVRTLLELHPDAVNAKTGLNGITSLDIALHHFPSTHPVITVLKSFQPVKKEIEEASNNLAAKEKEKTPNVEQSNAMDGESGIVQEIQTNLSNEKTENNDVNDQKHTLVETLNEEQQIHENIDTDGITDPIQQLRKAEESIETDKESMEKFKSSLIKDQAIDNDTAGKEDSSGANIDGKKDDDLSKETHTKQSEQIEISVSDLSSKNEVIGEKKMEESSKDNENNGGMENPKSSSQTAKKTEESIPEVVDFSQRDLVLAAHSGQCRKLKSYLEKRPQWALVRDENGWQPIHEAGRAGHAKCVEILLSFGANINSRTGPFEPRKGGSVLWWAMNTLDRRQYHNFFQFLKEHGAIEIAPGS